MNRKTLRKSRKPLCLAIMAATLGTGTSVTVTAKEGASGIEEIIVTARKREESLMEVPVAISAFNADTLKLRNINSVDNLARAVPNLLIFEGAGTVQGGNIVMRGISGADANPLGDQAVSFNFDGVQVARASIRRMSEMDIEQITVLKGPQALFYGKNSPGGVISVKTADPTEEFAAGITTGYEFEADEWRTDGFISGPISDTVGYRLAGFYTTMDGWVDSIVPASNPIQPGDDPAPVKDEWALRGTLTFKPTDQFDARLKLTYGETDGGSSTANQQYIDCAGPTAVFSPLDDCDPDDKVSIAEAGPIASPDFPADGEGYLEQEQMLFSGELNYRITDELTLTSVTGFYWMDLDNLGQYTAGYVPGSVLPSRNLLKIEEVSEEIRLTSDYDGRFNFMVGAFYQESRSETGSHTFLGAAGGTSVLGTPGAFPVNYYYLEQDGEAWSVFAQLQYDITEQLELSLGVRYSEEEKELDKLFNNNGFGDPNPPALLTPLVDNRDFEDTSPEITLTWRPSDRHTIYGSYKEGFLSGGFNGSSGTSTTDITYDQQTIDGFEFGVKSIFLDGDLQTNLALFSYDIEGLQVVVTTQGTIQQLRNAGEVSSDGAEFDFNYQTPIEGLSIYGAVAYLDGEYEDYQGSCYAGQTAASSVPCMLQISRVTGELSLLQDLSGTDLVRAPEWTGNLGFQYTTGISSDLILDILANVSFSEDYLTDPSSKEWARSPSYEMVDLTFRLSDAAAKWQVSLIGKNLTEEYYWTRNSDVPFSNFFTGGIADSESAVSRGRELWLQVTYNF